jgi:hypothetical protein
MTTRKSFKQVVRARMAKTGERYAAARRSLLASDDRQPGGSAPSVQGATTAGGYRLRGGLFPNSATVANVLANRGVTSGLTGEPLSEALVFGVAGGLGAGYILWEFKSRGGAILTLGFSNRWQYPAIPGWFGSALDRLGIAAEVHGTGGAKGAAETLDGILDAGDPAIVLVDQQALGTWGQPDELSGYGGYPVVVCGRTPDDAYLVDDRGRAPLVVAPETMAAARGRVGSYRHRLIRLKPDVGPRTADPLRDAIRAGLHDQVEHMASSSDSFSLPAWRKWSRLMTDGKNAKAWPRVFAGGRGLFGALVSIVEGVDGDVGAYGGHLRELYAQFLDEAAVALDQPPLGEAATRWRAAADRWEDLADAAVPPDLDGALEAVAAAEALHETVMAGEPRRAAAASAASTLWETRSRYADAFPLPADRIDELFADLGDRLAEIHVTEVEALASTADAVGRL